MTTDRLILIYDTTTPDGQPNIHTQHYGSFGGVDDLASHIVELATDLATLHELPAGTLLAADLGRRNYILEKPNDYRVEIDGDGAPRLVEIA